MYLGWQGTGKTLAARALAEDLIVNAGYSSIVANMAVYKSAASSVLQLSDVEMRTWLKKMATQHLRRQVVIVDEVDGVFPPRFWSDKEQTEALLGIWKDRKWDNQIILTAHLGIPSDKLIRDATRMLIFPEYIAERDCVELAVCDLRFGKDCFLTLNNASGWFDKYDSYE